MVKRQQFTAEFKREAVRQMQVGAKPTTQLSRELGVPRNRLYKWHQAVQVHGEKEAFPGSGRRSLEQAELMRLRRSLARAEQELEILKKPRRTSRAHPRAVRLDPSAASGLPGDGVVPCRGRVAQRISCLARAGTQRPCAVRRAPRGGDPGRAPGASSGLRHASPVAGAGRSWRGMRAASCCPSPPSARCRDAATQAVHACSRRIPARARRTQPLVVAVREQRAKPGLGRRHHPPAHPPRLVLSRGRARCLQSTCRRLGDVVAADPRSRRAGAAHGRCATSSRTRTDPSP